MLNCTVTTALDRCVPLSWTIFIVKHRGCKPILRTLNLRTINLIRVHHIRLLLADPTICNSEPLVVLFALYVALLEEFL